MRLGMMRCSRSISAAGTTSRISSDAERDRDGRVVRQHGADAQRGGERLDERVARRDRLAAAAAVPAQQQPGEHRDVVVGLDRRAAAGAVRGRRDQRLVARQPVGDDVQERADDRAEHAGEGCCLHPRDRRRGGALERQPPGRRTRRRYALPAAGRAAALVAAGFGVCRCVVTSPFDVARDR